MRSMEMARFITVFLALLPVLVVFAETPIEPEPQAKDANADPEEPPEGYYAFVESPNATPPRVRPPPYVQSASECAGVTGAGGAGGAAVSAHNLCGDLNRGIIPRSPLGHNPNGEPYPFELIRNHTLRFLSKTLPVLRADDALPRVAHVTPSELPQQNLPGVTELQHNRLEERSKRSVPEPEEVPASSLPLEHREAETPRESRKFCDGGGVFCMLYRAINGDSAGPERREDPGPHAPHAPHAAAAHAPHAPHAPHRYEGPPTPCPARVEYATPVFARNYQGVWRYVVQIPYEGYFTQTVEVTRCTQARCHYLAGGCLSSPRWLSLLVAELHYPPSPTPPPSAPHAQEYQAYNSPAAETSSEKPLHCDGHDEMGCFQVRLYYDWFLVPGSCKCWRPDYFARYVRRHNEL